MIKRFNIGVKVRAAVILAPTNPLDGPIVPVGTIGRILRVFRGLAIVDFGIVRYECWPDELNCLTVKSFPLARLTDSRV